MDTRAAAHNEAIGRWVSELVLTAVPDSVLERHRLVLADLLTVTSAGINLPEYQKLLQSWLTPVGLVPVPGSQVMTHTEPASFLFGTASVALELDEGSKYAKGHPASHVIPAALSLAAELSATGEEALLSIIAGYEVAAKFGQATTLNKGLHPHGNWGIIGGAAACAKLLKLSAVEIAAAMDHASGMVLAPAFVSALDGNLVRNSWMGAAANNSIVSARMAAAGIASNTGTVGSTLGGTIGTYDSDAVTAGLGLRWEVERNYFKRHAACAFTHPPLDAALSLRSQLGGSEQGIASIESIDVHTHYLAQSLNAPSPQTRLAAMFSIPYVISAALIDGELTPRQHDQSSLSNDQIASLASRVHVHNDPEFSANLPDKRGAKVIIRFIDGSEVSEQVEQPIGDSDFRPLNEADLLAKGRSLIPEVQVNRIWQYATELSTKARVNDLSHLLLQ